MEWSGCLASCGCLKMFSFWLHCGKIEYELNAKSNLINNIRFNQSYWMICTHTKSPTDVRLVWVCVIRQPDHTNGVWLGLVGFWCVLLVTPSYDHAQHFILQSDLNWWWWRRCCLSMYFKIAQYRICLVVRMNINWSLKADSCSVLKLFKYSPHPSRFFRGDALLIC